MNGLLTQKIDNDAILLTILSSHDFPSWLKNQSLFIQQWLKNTQFKAENNNFSLLPDESGILQEVVFILQEKKNFWAIGQLPFLLPTKTYYFAEEDEYSFLYALAWGLGAYQFNRYKSANKKPASLIVAKTLIDLVLPAVESICYVRDLINTPTDDLGPSELSKEVQKLSKTFNATFQEIVGEDLLAKGFNGIYTVGRASDDAPRLLELYWGNPSHKEVILVGKGVCFDTGGLDIKSATNMLLMKKDMAGAAHVLGLARMIMEASLPISLRVLIPAVENAISGNAYRPGDVIKSYKGLTIEIGNTDAEGRIILADAIAYGASLKPDLIIDMATLTGAGRIALGTDIAAMFCNNDDIANELLSYADKTMDPIWRLPLYNAYRESLNTPVADINNASSDGYGGAIVAALFLQEFIPPEIPWLHFDMMAWNLKSRPGRPQGGEAHALRALFAFLKARYH